MQTVCGVSAPGKRSCGAGITVGLEADNKGIDSRRIIGAEWGILPDRLLEFERRDFRIFVKKLED